MRATVITYINPAVAVVLGVTVLGEKFGPITAVGFAAVIGGSVLATRSLRPETVSAELGARKLSRDPRARSPLRPEPLRSSRPAVE